MRPHDKMPRQILWGTVAGALTAALLAAVVFLAFFALVILLFCAGA